MEHLPCRYKKQSIPKDGMPLHKYVKSWQKNRNRKDAAVASGSNRLAKALEYVPESESIAAFEPVGLNTPDNTTTVGVAVRGNSTGNGLQILCQVCCHIQLYILANPS